MVASSIFALSVGFPDHRRAARTTTLLRRRFGEERRRTNVIAYAFGGRAVLMLIYAARGRALAPN